MQRGAYGTNRNAAIFAALLCAAAQIASGQLNQNCTASVLNRSVQVNADGSWVLPNIPANLGQMKARATCVQNGVTISGESAFFSIAANTAVNLPAITLGSGTQIPELMTIAPATPVLTTLGQTLQLAVTARYPDASTKNVTAAATGTNYTTSNSAIASITPGGLITAVSSGNVVIQATNDGTPAIVLVKVMLSNKDSDGHGITDDIEITNGLNPNNPVDALEDADRDGLANGNEIVLGTNLRNADTDADGLLDGDEVNKHATKPLLADTDNDLIPDGIEITTGTNPNSATSYDLAKAASSATLTPSSFTLTVSQLNPNPTIQLTWKVTLIDGKTILDLTADPRTTFNSSSLSTCSFSGQKGLVFGQNSGTCTITAQNSTLSTTATGAVSGFTPSEVSALGVNGAIAVDVSGSFAYIAAGTNGLVVVDLGTRTNPTIRGTLAGIGNLVAIRAAGQNVVAADSAGFLRVFSVTNPNAPSLSGSLAISGAPAALAVRGNTVAVAAQAGGVSFVDIASPSAPSLISTIAPGGTAVGIDLDLQRGLAAVAMGTAGMQLIDITNLQSPQLRGTLTGGDVRQVLIRHPAVLLADVARSFSTANITNPSQPALSLSLSVNFGGAPVEIAAFGSIAITADVSFGAVVPVNNVSNPLTPVSLPFWNLGGRGFSSSIAMDNSYGYLIMPNTLRIYKYQNITDSLGVPPVVTITSPLSGTPLIQGQTITLAANALDDIGVVSVNFLVNGQVALSTTATPYQYAYTVPASATMLTFGATSVDYGNNVGTAANVQVQVIADPLTTISGRVVDSSLNPVAGATVSALSRSTATIAGGTFTLTGLPTIRGPIIVSAVATVNGVLLGGVSSLLQPLPGGIVPAGDLKLVPKAFITSVSPVSVLAGTSASVAVTGVNLSGSTFAFAPSGITVSSASINPAGTAATLALTSPPTASGRFTLLATNPAGPSDPTPAIGYVSGPAAFNTISVPGSNPTADADSDGLDNAGEVTRGTDALSKDTDSDGWQDGLEVALGSDPLNMNSIPNPSTSGWVSSQILSVLNALNPSTGIPGSSQYASSLTFSLLNALNPSTGIPGSSQYASSLTFSLLNALNPSTGIPGSSQYASSLTFSLLNALNPSGAPIGSQYVSSLAVSILNSVSPASSLISQQFVSGLIFSVENTAPASAGSIISSRSIRAGQVPSYFDSPLNINDTDGDGVLDEGEMLIGTNSFDRDTDRDGYPDGLELALGSNPLDLNSVPNINSPNFVISPAVLIWNYILQGKLIVPVRPAEVRK